jgi:hypothetical protein
MTLHRALRNRARFLATASILAIGIASIGTPAADDGNGGAGCLDACIACAQPAGRGGDGAMGFDGQPGAAGDSGTYSGGANRLMLSPG